MINAVDIYIPGKKKPTQFHIGGEMETTGEILKEIQRMESGVLLHFFSGTKVSFKGFPYITYEVANLGN